MKDATLRVNKLKKYLCVRSEHTHTWGSCVTKVLFIEEVRTFIIDVQLVTCMKSFHCVDLFIFRI